MRRDTTGQFRVASPFYQLFAAIIGFVVLHTPTMAQSPDDYDWSFAPLPLARHVIVTTEAGETRRLLVGAMTQETRVQLIQDGVLPAEGAGLYIVKDPSDADALVRDTALAEEAVFIFEAVQNLEGGTDGYQEYMNSQVWLVAKAAFPWIEKLSELIAKGTGAVTGLALVQAPAAPATFSAAVLKAVQAGTFAVVADDVRAWAAGLGTEPRASDTGLNGLRCVLMDQVGNYGEAKLYESFQYTLWSLRQPFGEDATLREAMLLRDWQCSYQRANPGGAESSFNQLASELWRFDPSEYVVDRANDFIWGVAGGAVDGLVQRVARPELAASSKTDVISSTFMQQAQGSQVGNKLLRQAETALVEGTVTGVWKSVEKPNIFRDAYFENCPDDQGIVSVYFAEYSDQAMQALQQFTDRIEWASLGQAQIIKNLLFANPVAYVSAEPGEELGSTRLSWISPGFADGGTAQEYLIRYLPYNEAVGEDIRAAWDGGVHYTGHNNLLDPQEPGVVESWTITGLMPSRQYSFMVRAVSPNGALTPLLQAIVGSSSADASAINLWQPSASPEEPTIDTAAITFSILYKHRSGLWPTQRELYFDGQPYTLAAVAGTPENGVEYRVSVPGPFVAGATCTYHFSFTDSEGITRREPPYTGEYYIFIDAVLRQPAVVPDEGANPRGFTFRVRYVHPAGLVPRQAVVLVDNVLHAMQYKSGDYLTGVIFESWVPLASGIHSYYFRFSDGAQTYRLPSSGSFDGPTVSAFHNAGIILTQGGAPAEIAGGTPLAIGVAAVNNGSVSEASLQLRLLVDGNPLGEPINVEPLPPGGVSAQYVLNWSPPVQDTTATYTLTAEVIGVADDLNTADNQLDWSVQVVPPPGSITGIVRDGPSNAPKPGATVFVVSGPQSASATSDVDGNFLLDGLPPGGYVIAAHTDDGLSSGNSPTLVVHAAQQYSYSLTLDSVSIQQLTSYGPPVGGGNDRAPSWSPDSATIAYHHTEDGILGQWRILIVATGDSSTVSGFTSTNPTWAPQWLDDNTVIFGGTYQVSPGVWIHGLHKIRLSDGARLATLDAEAYGLSRFACAPGATRLYFSDGDFIRSVRTSDFGDVQTLLTAQETGRLAISRDGRYLALAQQAKIFDLQSGNYLNLSHFPSSDGFSLGWLPDSSGLVYGLGGDLYVYLLAGERHIQITFGNPNDWAPDAAPADLNKVAFASDRNYTPQTIQALFKMDLAPSDWFLAFSNVVASASAITPNGDGMNDSLTLAYDLTSPAMITLKIYDSASTLVAAPVIDQQQQAGANNVVWTGAGINGLLVPSALYFYALDARDSDGHNAISYRGRATVAREIRVVSDGYWNTWSPDQTWIAYVKNGRELWTVNSDGSNPINIYTVSGGDVSPLEGSICISHDGQWILFGRDVDSGGIALERIRRDGSDLQRLASPGDAVTDVPVPAGGFSQPYSSPADGSVICGVSYSPPGSQYFQVCVMNEDGSNKRKVTSLGAVGNYSWMYPSCSLDGSLIVFGSAYEDPVTSYTNIYQVAPDGSGFARVTNWWGSETYPRWTADGSHLLFGAALLSPSNGWYRDLFVLKPSTLRRTALMGNVEGAEPSASGHKLLIWGTSGQGAIVTLSYSLTAGIVEGVARDSLGQVLAGATIEARREDVLVGIALSNAQGYYRVADLPVGSVTLSARKYRYLDSVPIPPVTTTSGDTSTAADLVLVPLPMALPTSLRSNGRYSGTLDLTAQALTSNVTSVAYEYQLDGAGWNPIDTATVPPYVVAWDTSALVAPGEDVVAEVRAIAAAAGDLVDPDPVRVPLILDRLSPESQIASPLDGDSIGRKSVAIVIDTSLDSQRIMVEYKHSSDAEWRALAETGSLTDNGAQRRATLIASTQGMIPGETYYLRAFATDEAGNVESPAGSISVIIPVNTTPVANAGPDQVVTDTDGNGAETVTLDGSGSSDSDGTIGSYVWSEGATAIATGVKPQVVLALGTHDITLMVTDDEGASATDTVCVTVTLPPTGACCVGQNCEVLTAAACTAQSGDYKGDNIPCGASTCPPTPTGACCVNGSTCETDATEAWCTSNDGVWQGVGSTSCTDCPPTPTGACCRNYNESCEDGVTEADCAGAHDTWYEDQTCAQVTCPQTPPPRGACCRNYDESCENGMAEADCAGAHDTWHEGDACADVTCPETPRGACCYQDYTCAITTQANCGGTWQGSDTTCSQCPPPPAGACCRNYAESCENGMAEADCAGAHDTWHEGDACADVTCPEPPPCDDADGDDICDENDRCPNTPVGEQVDSHGCSCSQLDDDGDGVINCDDACPDTAGSCPDGCPPRPTGLCPIATCGLIGLSFAGMWLSHRRRR